MASFCKKWLEIRVRKQEQDGGEAGHLKGGAGE